LLDDARACGSPVLFGGGFDPDSRRVEATILMNPDESTRVMQEEIFGPILPFIVVDSVDEALDRIAVRPKPLSTYIYTQDERVVGRFSASVRTGAVCKNTTLLQFVQPFGPFGGEGNSGIGRSHGEAGFRAFSNEQVVLRRRWGAWILRLLQPPYSARTSWLGRLFRRFT
ncbi:MAG: aldehyde dehydrogenase family protein, partial [Bacteroidetes bacterium]|nr:aldehyde dehydrogenase family protein [Bacteroidota bacterium]